VHLAVVHTAAGSFGRQLGEPSFILHMLHCRQGEWGTHLLFPAAGKTVCRCICLMPAEKTAFALVCVCVCIRGATCASLVHICCIRKLCIVPAFSMAHQDTQCAACLLLHFHVSTPCRPLDLQVLYESVFFMWYLLLPVLCVG
jgi:hypothetical protein